MMLFNDGSQRAAHANAVAPHLEVLLFAVLVQEGGVEGAAVFVAQLEDLAHLDTTGCR